MASLPTEIGARSIYRTFFPLKAVSDAIDTGLLPKLNQDAAPQGYDLAYNLAPLGPQASVADARAALIEQGGLPVSVVREPEPDLPWWQQAAIVAGGLLGFTSIGGALGSTFQSVNTQEGVNPYAGKAATFAPTQGGAMAFQDGDSGFFGDIFGGLNQALQGGLGGSLLNIGQQALTGFVQQQFAPQPVSMGGAVATMASVPAIARAGGAVATVGRGFFSRFPNLATSIQALRNRGSNVTRSSLYSAMRRFGPEMLVSGGLLTAAAVSELAVAGPGRRRMNPGNVKALRRAHRRMKSFHKVCVDNDQLYKRSRKR